MLETLKLWAWRFAIFVSVLMAVVSFYAGEGFLRIVISGILGFVIIYGLSYGSILLFEKTSVDNSELGDVGVLLDVAVGQDDELLDELEQQDEGNTSTETGVTAEIEEQREEVGVQSEAETQGLEGSGVQNQRANGTGLNGQLNQELADGLPSAEKQAEIVRRMGWEE
ncbi:MAG: hypothetical protein GX958_11760 [Desulfitobacterium sp.]|nr:hypothetical protein [Desulfitobacterium sp.]